MRHLAGQNHRAVRRTTQSSKPRVRIARRAALAGHDGRGALAHERDRHRMGADAVACDQRAVGRDRDLARISGVDEATLRRQRCRVRGEHEHVFDGEVLNRGLHQLRFRPGPRAVLEVVELPDRVARRAPRNSRYRAEAIQIRTVTARALDGLAAPPVAARARPFSILPTGTYAVNRTRESRLTNRPTSSGTSTMRWPSDSFSPVVEGAKNQPVTELLGIVSVSTTRMLARGLIDAKYEADASTSAVVGRFRRRDHQLLRDALWQRGCPHPALEVGHLLDDVGGWKTKETGVLRTAGSVGAMAHAARHDVRLPALRDNFRHRGMIGRVPIGCEKKVAQLGERESRSAVRDPADRPVVGCGFPLGRIHRVRPRWRRLFRVGGTSHRQSECEHDERQ